MSSVNIVDFTKVEILPSNQPALGVFSFRKGNPIVTFQIPSQARYLKTNTLRINGRLKITGGAGATLPNNNNSKGGGANAVTLSSRVGVHSCFQNVNLVSAGSNQSLESIRQYGRLVASLLSSPHSSQDMATEKSCVAVMNGIESSSSLMVNNEVNFSVPLYAGMLQGTSLIPLSLVQGIGINIELASDQQVLKGANAGAGDGAFYELSDLSLTCDLAVPDAEGVQQLSQAGTGSLEFNTFSSLYSVINSSDATQTYNLANSRVLSIVHNFLPVSHSNSYDHDVFTTDMLKNIGGGGDYTADVELRRVSFSRNGVPFGVDYEYKCADQSSSKIPETQVMMKYLQAYQPLGRMLNSRRLLDYGGQPLRVDRPADKTANRDHGIRADAARNFGIGLSTDDVSDVGVDFKNQAYATRIVSSLNGQSPNAVFTHLLCKNVLTYSPQGITVSN